MSAIEVPVSQIKSIPTLLGEADLIKALQLLPGVQSGTEGATGMYVRGGGPDENLFLLDGIPVYNINHMAGFFSVFNPDAIKNVTLYKGNFPARFGGRLSSVIDVRMNDGNDKKLHGNLSVGIISSKINLEGPLFTPNTTFNISARRTYSDLLIQPVLYFTAKQESADKNLTAGYYFYDLNAKVNHKFSDKDRLFLSFYSGDDVMYANIRDGYRQGQYETEESRLKLNWNWGNIVGSARWNHIINNKLFMNTTAAYTRYRFDMSIGSVNTKDSANYTSSEEIEMGYFSGIEDYTLKTDFDYSPHPDHNIKFGTNYTHHTFKPGVTSAKQTIIEQENTLKIDTTFANKDIYSNELSFYVEDDISIGSLVRVNAGLHYALFNVQDETYHSLQPRLGMRVLAGSKLSFKAGYAAMSQYVHLLSNSSISLPTDLWVPVTSRIKPMRSHQYSIGAFYNLNNMLDFSVEAYYKSMHNLIEYKDGASFLRSGTGWEDKVVLGDGWAYGIEFLAQKTIGKTTGWIAYTWSKAERLFNRPGQELNQGKVFPAKYDRRHDISIVCTHVINDRIDISGTWVFSTGNTGTLSLQDYGQTQLPDSKAWYWTDYNNNITRSLPYYSGRNNYRFNPYHRMDIGINFHKQKKYGKRTWNISIYNLYNNNNPLAVYREEKTTYNPENDTYTTRKPFVQLSLFPIIPSVSYSYKW